MLKFSISEKEGIEFSKLSGDYNKIHLDDLYGYNSQFNQKICHGCLVIIKVFKLLKIEKLINDFLEFNISINFTNPFYYKKKIVIKKINNNRYILVQNGEASAQIIISNKASLSINNYTLKKEFQPRIKLNKKFKNFEKISILLCYLSKYVGVIYPGENSLIKSISINFIKNKFFNNNIKIFSKKIDKRLPLIKNEIFFENYKIEFDTLDRPKLKLKFKPISKEIKNKITSIKDNLLIIGASSGIGNDILQLFKFNKKIKIIATYYKNKISLANRNIIKKRIDIKKDLKIVFNIIKKYTPIIIYYFPTPKIYSNKKNNLLDRLYNKFYFDVPIKILKFAENYNVKFFYPSTIYDDKLLSYSSIKNKAEKKFMKIQLNNTVLNVLKIREVNTKQNLSILNKNLPNFRDLLNKDKNYQKKIFFLD